MRIGEAARAAHIRRPQDAQRDAPYTSMFSGAKRRANHSYHSHEFDFGIPEHDHAGCLQPFTIGTPDTTLPILLTDVEPSSASSKTRWLSGPGPPRSAARFYHDGHKTLAYGEGVLHNLDDGPGWTFVGSVTPGCQPPSTSVEVSPPIYDVPSTFAIDPAERNAMHYFHTVVAEDLSGVVASDFWKRSVHQMCQMEDAAKQAAVALSQAHMEVSFGQPLSRPPCAIRMRFSMSPASLKAVLKASQALRTYLEGNTSPSHELVLTCSIMFCTIENLLGREADAIVHLENGLKMFRSWQRERKQIGAKCNETYESLEAAFARLDLSATIANDSRVPIFEYDDGFDASCHEARIRNMSIADARDAHHKLMRIATPAWAFIVRNQEWRRRPARSVPKGIIEEQLLHQSRYSAWSTAMDMFECDRLWQNQFDLQATQDDRRAQAISLLATRMHYWCAKRMLEESVPRDDDVCIWDRNPHKVFRYAKAIVAYTDEIRQSSGSQRHTSFSPEIGICGILLLTAHRTRLPKIRSEALELAHKFDRKEGARDLCGAFESWLQLPQPKPTFTFMLGEAGH